MLHAEFHDIIPMHCINLLRAKDRRERIQRDWVVPYGFQIEFFEAFDRRDLPEKAVLRYNSAQSMQYNQRDMTSGEIACSTSHYLLSSQLLAAGACEAIIMEDDVYPHQGAFTDVADFMTSIRQAIHEFPQILALVLHDYRKSHFPAILANSTAHTFIVEVPPWGTRMIWYSRGGLELLRNALAHHSLPSDHALRHCFPQGSVGVLRTPLAGHYSTESYIENERFETNHRKYIE